MRYMRHHVRRALRNVNVVSFLTLTSVLHPEAFESEMTSWIWSVPEDEWPVVKRDDELLRTSVSAQLEALELNRRCET